MVISLSGAVSRLATARRRREDELAGFAQGDAAAAAGMAAAGTFDGAGRAIFIGVTTGVLVWTVTRVLDRAFGISR